MCSFLLYHIYQPGISLKILTTRRFLCPFFLPPLPCRMRIMGELPSLNVGMSDMRLQEILQLAQSIPLPEGGTPSPPVDEIELDVSNSWKKVLSNLCFVLF